MIKVDSDIDVEENMSLVGPLRNYILMKPWSFRSNKRNTKNRVNKIDERALRLVYDESRNLPFEGLLVKGNSVSIYIKKIIKKKLLKKAKQDKVKYFRFIIIHKQIIHLMLQRKKAKPFILALIIYHVYHLKYGNFFLNH